MTKDERDVYINDGWWDLKKPARATVKDDPTATGVQQLIHRMDKMNPMPGHEFRQEMLCKFPSPEVTFDEIEAKLKELKFKPDGSIDTGEKLVIIDGLGFLRQEPPVLTEPKLSPAVQATSDRIDEEERLTREAVDRITKILSNQLRAFTGIPLPPGMFAATAPMMEAIAAQVRSAVDAMSKFCSDPEIDVAMDRVFGSCPDYPPLDCGSNPLPQMLGLDAQIKAHDKQWAETNKNGGLPIGQPSTFYGAPSRPGMSDLGGLFAVKYGLPKNTILTQLLLTDGPETPSTCECGAHKASGTPRGSGHSSWCPWAK